MRLEVERLVGAPLLGLLDDRLLPGRLRAVALDGDDVRGVQRAHDVEVLALVAQVEELLGDGLKAHEKTPDSRGGRGGKQTLKSLLPQRRSGRQREDTHMLSFAFLCVLCASAVKSSCSELLLLRRRRGVVDDPRHDRRRRRGVVADDAVDGLADETGGEVFAAVEDDPAAVALDALELRLLRRADDALGVVAELRRPELLPAGAVERRGRRGRVSAAPSRGAGGASRPTRRTRSTRRRRRSRSCRRLSMNFFSATCARRVERERLRAGDVDDLRVAERRRAWRLRPRGRRRALCMRLAMRATRRARGPSCRCTRGGRRLSVLSGFIFASASTRCVSPLVAEVRACRRRRGRCSAPSCQTSSRPPTTPICHALAGSACGMSSISSRTPLLRPEHARLGLPLLAGELLLGVDRVVVRQLAELVAGEQLGRRACGATRRTRLPAVGVGEDHAAASTYCLSFALSSSLGVHSSLAAEVEDRRVVQLVGGRVEVDDLPVQVALDRLPIQRVRLATSRGRLVPVADLRAFGAGGVVELVERRPARGRGRGTARRSTCRQTPPTCPAGQRAVLAAAS